MNLKYVLVLPIFLATFLNLYSMEIRNSLLFIDDIKQDNKIEVIIQDEQILLPIDNILPHFQSNSFLDKILLPIRKILAYFGFYQFKVNIKIEKENIFTIEDIQYSYKETLEDVLNTDIFYIQDLEAIKIHSNFKPIFKVYNPIPQYVLNKMLGKSLPNMTMAENICLVEITYYNYKFDTEIGCLVVHKELGFEVAEIFEKLYDIKFPINSLLLVDNFGANDTLSMRANNSSAFNYRVIAGTDRLSNHSHGTAIDLNPLVNPHVIRGVANPKEGQKYADRTVYDIGSINDNHEIVRIFKSYNWIWGGDWNNPDYQHFEKKININ